MVVPYPSTAQVGLTGLVNPAGGLVVVTVVVKVGKDIPAFEEAAQYPVP